MFTKLVILSTILASILGQYAPTYDYNPYHFSWNVIDDYAQLNYGQEEGREAGNPATSGQYHVLLPDGRVQTVTYNVGDAYTGYVANVEYSGSAHHNDAILYTTPRPQKYVKYVEPHRIYTTPKPAEPIYTTPKPVEKIAPVEKIEHKQYGPVFREHFAKKTNYY